MIHKELWIARMHGIDQHINLGNVVNYVIAKLLQYTNVIYSNLINNSDKQYYYLQNNNLLNVNSNAAEDTGNTYLERISESRLWRGSLNESFERTDSLQWFALLSSFTVTLAPSIEKKVVRKVFSVLKPFFKHILLHQIMIF